MRAEARKRIRNKGITLEKPLKSSLLRCHYVRLQEVLREQFARDLDETLPKKLPLVKWSCPQKTPGAVSIYLLSLASPASRIPSFLEELISQWLVPGDRLFTLSTQNLIFRMPAHKRHRFLFATLLVQIETPEQLNISKKSLPSLSQELLLGVQSSGNARSILELKKLPFQGKSKYIYENLFSWMRRFPKRFKKEILHEAQHFLLDAGEKFLSIRDMRHLSRIISFYYLFRKDIERKIKTHSRKRHLLLKIRPTYLQYPFGLKRVLSLIIGMHTLGEHERFGLRHILKAVQKFIPNIHPVKNSFYSHKIHHDPIQTLYLEIEKNRGEEFALSELLLLSKELPQELKLSIEILSPSLFIPRNEEEIYRNIVTLSGELKYVRDLPQAVISFQEQKENLLKFNVILLRLLHKDCIPISEKAKELPPHIHFIPEKVTRVGTLRKKYIKEANIFLLEVETHLFLRGNHSVDLVKARQFMAKVVQMLVGPYRDYNGGLLFKQNEQLDKIKERLNQQWKRHDLFIENLFYSLYPPLLQTTLPMEAVITLFHLILSTLDEDVVTPQNVVVKQRHHKDFFSCAIKASQEEIKTLITDCLFAETIQGCQVGIASIEADGYFYLGVLYQSPENGQRKRIEKTIEIALNKWKKRQKNLQLIRIHLPRAARSLDPRIGTDRNSAIIIKMLYEGLMRIGKQGNPEPAIAKAVTLSRGGKRYLFQLRESYWSNGAELTAHDFEYAWKKIIDPDFPSVYSFLFASIKGATLAKKGELPLKKVGIKAVDNKRLLVDLMHTNSNFLSLTAHWAFAPLCREIDQHHPGWAYHNAETYVCNGPFKLDHWKINDELQLIPNPYYWDRKIVKLGKIQVRIVEDSETALALFKRGQLDWVGDPVSKIPLSRIEKLKKEGFLEENPISCLFWLQVNTNRLPFTNVNIRQAFGKAIHRQKIMSQVLKSDDKPALGLSNTPLFEELSTEQARHLFAKGLDELGITDHQLPAITFSHSDFEEHEKISRFVGKRWEEVFGIEVKYEKLRWDPFVHSLIDGQHMIAPLPWYPRYDDELFYYLSLFHFPESQVYPISRITKWRDPAFSALLENAQKIHDLEEREYVLKEAEKILIDAMPIIPLFFQKLRYVKNPRLKNVMLSNVGQIDFRGAYLQ